MDEVPEISEQQPKPVRRRGRGRPFQPGQSGNPGGRPRDVGEVRALARKHAAEAIRTLAELMRSADRDVTRVAAAQALLDRGYGRPTQPLSGDEDAAPIEFVIRDLGKEE